MKVAICWPREDEITRVEDLLCHVQQTLSAFHVLTRYFHCNCLSETYPDSNNNIVPTSDTDFVIFPNKKIVNFALQTVTQQLQIYLEGGLLSHVECTLS